MEKVIRVLLIVSAAAYFVACGPKKETVAFELGGPCEECPFSRLDSLLKLKEGVLAVTFEKGNEKVTIEFDANKLHKDKLFDYINEHGYDAGPNEPALNVNGVGFPMCCEVDSSALDSLDQIGMIDDSLDKDLESTFDKEMAAEMDIDISDDMAVSEELDEDNLFDEDEVDKALASDALPGKKQPAPQKQNAPPKK